MNQSPTRQPPLRILLPLLAVVLLGIGFAATRGDDDGDRDALSSEEGLPVDDTTADTGVAPAVEDTLVETTTAVPSGRQVSFKITSADGWIWIVEALVPTQVSFRKDVSSSPPGYARLVMSATGKPSGTIVSATGGGRISPQASAAVYFARFKITTNRTQPDQSRSWSGLLNCQVPTSGTFSCNLGNFGSFLPGTATTFEESFGDYSEDVVDELVSQLGAQQPTFEIGASPTGGCTALLAPDGSITQGGNSVAGGCTIEAL